MKKTGVILTLLIVAALLSGCGAGGGVGTAGGSSNELVVKEELFYTILSDVYMNLDRYAGQTVRIAGVLSEYEYEGTTYRTVMRLAGCCGTDDVPVGLEFEWDGDLPDADSWIEVVGELVIATDAGETYPMIHASQVKPTKAGLYTVYQ